MIGHQYDQTIYNYPIASSMIDVRDKSIVSDFGQYYFVECLMGREREREYLKKENNQRKMPKLIRCERERERER